MLLNHTSINTHNQVTPPTKVCVVLTNVTRFWMTTGCGVHIIIPVVLHLNSLVQVLLQCTGLVGRVIVHAITVVPYFGLKKELLVSQLTVHRVTTVVVLGVR